MIKIAEITRETNSSKKGKEATDAVLLLNWNYIYFKNRIKKYTSDSSKDRPFF